jgi:hypothetical protein
MDRFQPSESECFVPMRAGRLRAITSYYYAPGVRREQNLLLRPLDEHYTRYGSRRMLALLRRIVALGVNRNPMTARQLPLLRAVSSTQVSNVFL